MNVVRRGHTFSHRGPLSPARSDVPHLPLKKPIPTGGDTSAKQLILNPIPPNDRTTKDWTVIAWPTNIQSKTPDGQFGPAKQMEGWNDCWFLASLAAVAHAPGGRKILAQSIKKVNDGYVVTFKGMPDKKVFISEAELQELLETGGGDADTRLIELAADKFFKERGNFKVMTIALLLSTGMDQKAAEQCFQNDCQHEGIHNPMTFNPIRGGGTSIIAFFMLTGKYPDYAYRGNGVTLQETDVMNFLNVYAANDQDGGSVAISGEKNPLGDSPDARDLVIEWDLIRTDITSNGTVDEQERAFLNALDRWLATRMSYDLQALQSAAGNLNLEHIDPAMFVHRLTQNLFNLDQDHFNLLRSGVQKVLAGGSGYIGFTGDHCGTVEGINEAAGKFSYSEPSFPTLVHTGDLSRLIQDIISGNTYLSAARPTIGQDEAESSHAGEQRGRHLRQIYHQVVRDGKIDPAESGPLANLMEMDDGTFWQAYDSEKNGVIEGGELKAVQLRVDRWVDHFKSTPIW